MEFISQNYITLSLAAAFLATFFAGPLTVKWCKKLLNMDDVVQRQHTEPTPSSGGIGFAPVIAIFMILFTFTDYSDQHISIFLLVMAVCSIGVAVLGFLDDKHDLSPKVRLIGQWIATTLPILLLPDVWPGITDFVEKPILILGWIWFLNLYNFIDGIDGYAATEAIVIAAVGAVLAPKFAPLFMVIVFAMLGFLRVNLPMPRAKIFMGDVGSTFLGYTLGGLMFASIVPNEYSDGSLAFSFFTIVMLFSCDATQTLVKRFIRGQKPLMQAHQEHWFARMYALKFSHKKILGLGIMVNIALVVIVMLTYDSSMRFVSPIFGILVFSVLAYYVKYCEKKAGIKPLGFRKQK
jgi:Fuc2NAc and GlcNAc transferase